MRRPPDSAVPPPKCQFYRQAVFVERLPFASCPNTGTVKVDDTIPPLWFCREHHDEYQQRKQGTLMYLGRGE